MLAITGSVGADRTAEAAAISDDDWLGVLNVYRTQSGLAPVAENGAWSADARNHSCWMLQNGIAHDEAPGTPGYTVGGDAAGNASNVAVSSDASVSARYYIDLWMSAPFHAIGVLRSGFHTTGFGKCTSPPNPSSTPWKSGGTLDVIRGVDWGAARPSTPVVFPGDGATTSITRFVAESPDPRSFCGWNGQAVGLPLIALMPSSVSHASATLTGPSGPISTCVLHGANTTGVAKSILGGDNAVVVVPAAPFEKGTYSVSVSSNGGNASWAFNVDPDAVIGAPFEPDPPHTRVIGTSEPLTTVAPFRFADSRLDMVVTRLPAQTVVRFGVAGHKGVPADASAISANFTVAEPSAGGYLTAYGCDEGPPAVSTLNYAAGDVVANHAIVALASNGDLCLYSHADTEIVIDINGFTLPGGTAQLATVQPARVLDTRGGAPVAPGDPRVVVVEGDDTPVPEIATAVVINLTAVSPLTSGWIRAYPCDVDEPGSSTLNVWVGQTRANSAIVPTAADGTICLRATSTTDVLIDITGWVGPGGSFGFTPLQPTRLADTRSWHRDLNPRRDGEPLEPHQVLRVPVAGVRGVPEHAKAATLNVVAANAAGGGYLQVVPCGTGSSASTVNFHQSDAVANGTTVKLGADGAVCVVTSQSTHVIVDITGVWL